MIGFFDSGFGGLAVMKEYLKTYPEFNYVYLGDQANAPYGPHSKERIIKLTLKGIDHLVKRACKLIIIACNTASADALKIAQEKYKGSPVILGVIVPTAETALISTRFGVIGLIATRGTVKSGAYEREIQKYISYYNPEDKRAREKVILHEQPCPLLVPLVEEGMTDHPATRMILKNYLRPLKNSNVDTLILGCTHYPLLKKEITKIMGKRCKIVSSAEAAVESIGRYFTRHPELKESLSHGKKRVFLTTDCPDRFAEHGKKFLGQNMKVEKIDLNGED